MPRIPYLIFFLLATFLFGCAQRNYNYTEDENTNTVKLRNELMSLAKGEKKEIVGNTQPGEGYVLMYGYMTDIRFSGRVLSTNLRSKLSDISPKSDYEEYVLAHFQGDNILEYTKWVNDGRRFPWHPYLRSPLIIRGDPYSVQLKENSPGDVEISP